MTTSKDKALRQALEGFENIKHHFDTDEYAYEVAVKSITVIKQALAQEKALQALHNENERLGLYKDAYGQPKPEPVAWMDEFGNTFPLGAQRGPKYLNEPMKPLYTSPPKREWQGLTDEEKSEIYHNQKFVVGFYSPAKFADAIEAKLKEKNT